MALGRQSETYRGALVTPFGFQDVTVRTSWRHRRDLTEVTVRVDSAADLLHEIVVEVTLEACAVRNSTTSVARDADGAVALAIVVGAADSRRGAEGVAVVAPVVRRQRPVSSVEVEGRPISRVSRWRDSRPVAFVAGAALVGALAAGAVFAVDVLRPREEDSTAILAGENGVDGSSDTTVSASDTTVSAADPTVNAPVATAPATGDPVTSVPTPNSPPTGDNGAAVAPPTSVPVDGALVTEKELFLKIDGRSANWLVIPRLGLTSPIVRGVGDSALARGIGRYTHTATIGGPGNLGLAAHRTTKPAPFRHLDTVKVGDAVVVVTKSEVLRYVVEEAAPGKAYIEVAPSTVSVLESRGYDGLTLTTCTPVGSAARRLIVFARLTGRTPR